MRLEKIEENIWFPPPKVGKILDKIAKNVILENGGLRRSLAMYAQVEYEERAFKAGEINE